MPGWPHIHLYSVYGVTGVGLNQENRRILAAVGACMTEDGLHLAGGDFNLSPSEVEHSGFLAHARMVAVVPSQPTCFQSTPTWRDFFLMAKQLADV
eukprot:892295-Prorocentrum_lima.AAC.1